MTHYGLKGVKWVSQTYVPHYRTRFDRPFVKRAEGVWFADHIDDAKLYKTRRQAEKALEAIHAGADKDHPHWNDIRIVEIEVTRTEKS